MVGGAQPIEKLLELLPQIRLKIPGPLPDLGRLTSQRLSDAPLNFSIDPRESHVRGE